jgi:hypothetical protein
LPDESELQKLVRDRLGVRIGPRMSEYLRRRLAAPHQSVPIIGADARTGVALRQTIDPAMLMGEVIENAARAT